MGRCFKGSDTLGILIEAIINAHNFWACEAQKLECKFTLNQKYFIVKVKAI